MILYTKKLQQGGLFPVNYTLRKKMINFEDDSLYKEVLNHVAKDANAKVEDIQKIMALTSYHESRNMNKAQDSGGPGRGYYQFELKSVPVAAKRLSEYLTSREIAVPAWVEKIKLEETYDATRLTPTQQNLLFLGEHRQKPTSPFTGYLQGKVSAVDWWAQGHNTKKEKANKAGFERDSLEILDKPLPDFITAK